MFRIFLLFAITITIVSCSNSRYYDLTETYYDLDKSVDLIRGLKEGTLIVQIPCERRKLEVLKKVYINQKDPEKKQEQKEEYEKFKDYLKFVQETIIENTINNYSFSKYAFVPDTLITAFKKGQRENIFLDASFEFTNDVKIDASELTLFLRGQRDYDYLCIHEFNGKFPPRPFPYNSNLSTLEKPAFGTHFPFDRPSMSIFIRDAIANVNNKLNLFYEKHKPQNE